MRPWIEKYKYPSISCVLSRGIAYQKMNSALIVDDEFRIRETLHRVLDHDNVENKSAFR